MSTSPEVLNIRLSIIKDRHQACPKVNYIVHSTSILYGIRIIISLIMHSNNSSNRHTETAVRYPAVSSLFKVGRFHAVLVRNVRTNSGKESICAKYI